MLRIKFIPILTCLTLPLVISGCNAFSSYDKPKTDAQLLSAARAAFDQGKLVEARSLYERISNDYGDIRRSELAFADLTEQGASMTALIEFVANKANGSALTRFAKRLAPGAGEARRLAIYNAYTQHTNIIDPALKAFVKFTASLALTAEILAEASSTDGILQKTDLISSRSCTADLANPANLVNCALPLQATLTNTSADDIATTSPSGAQPSIDHLYYAILSAYDALSSLAPGGSFGDTSNSFLNILQGGAKPSGDALLTSIFLSQLVASDGFNIGE